MPKFADPLHSGQVQHDENADQESAGRFIWTDDFGPDPKFFGRNSILMISKAVLPVAGEGTRLFPVTKEQPKTMLPVFDRGTNGELCVKPLLQMIYEQLFDSGVREFLFVVGRDRLIIQNHFTPDFSSVDDLASKGKAGAAENLRSFYQIVDASEITWVDQRSPNGFGDAVLQAERFVGDDDFIVHAGDTFIRTEGDWHLRRFIERGEHSEITMMVRPVMNPERFGVIRSRLSNGEHVVLEAIEKPRKYISNLAIMPIYSFTPSIFAALRSTGIGFGGEIQLTDGIQRSIQKGQKVRALELPIDSVWVDVGTPESYWEAQELTHNLFSKENRLMEAVVNARMIQTQQRVV
jgi:UTP--glucose-1-phosphate uridylyltransferase